jgi:hypothetical protein
MMLDMPAKFDVTRQTKVPIQKAMDYFSHPEDQPKVHPDFVKSVTVKSSQGDSILFEQQMAVMGRKLVSQNKMIVNRAENRIEIDTLEGDGKGSKITLSFAPNQAGTEIKWHAEMELGPLGLLAKGPARSQFEKVATEDAANLDAST